MAQWKWYVPAVANVMLYVSPALMRPEVGKAPLSDIIWCVVWSPLTQRTPPPSARVTVLGLGSNAAVVRNSAPCTMLMSPTLSGGVLGPVLLDPQARAGAGPAGPAGGDEGESDRPEPARESLRHEASCEWTCCILYRRTRDRAD